MKTHNLFSKMGNKTGKLEALWFNPAEDVARFRPPAWIGLCVSTLARLCRHLILPWCLNLSAISACGVPLGHCGYLKMTSKKKSLSPPENLWLGPPPPQFPSFISSLVLPTTTSSFNPTELLGDVWVGMDTICHGEATRRFSTTDSDTLPDPHRRSGLVEWP